MSYKHMHQEESGEPIMRSFHISMGLMTSGVILGIDCEKRNPTQFATKQSAQVNY
jgi:hypothetical protein